MRLDEERRRWRIRIRDSHDNVLGAGMMLDSRHALTCAHVLQDTNPGAGPGTTADVELVGLDGAPRVGAAVVDWCWVPPLDDERGDIALLRLDVPSADAAGAPLHRMPMSLRQAVRVFGFPGAAPGIWVAAEIAGDGGPHCEWVQLNTTPGAEPISPGFSGAAVVDVGTGNVIGMVVGRYTGAGTSTAWMIPVETMVGHVRQLDPFVRGDRAVDDGFVREPIPGMLHEPFARELASWFGGTTSGEVWVKVTGEADSAIASTLRLAVRLTDRERPSATDDDAGAPPGSRPPRGSVALAVDASGKTSDQVVRHLTSRLGIDPPRGNGPGTRHHGQPRTLVVDAIDDAVDPERLVREVINPLVQESAQLGIRLFLGFRRDDSPEVTEVRSSIPRPAAEHTDPAARLDRLAGNVARLGDVEEQQRYLLQRFTGVPPVAARAGRMRGVLHQLRDAESNGEHEWLSAALTEAEAAAERALDEGLALARELDRKLARRAELRSRLDGYQQLAASHGLAEHPELEPLREAASRLLWQGRCDLAEAEQAVAGYGTAVHERIEGRRYP